MSMLSGLLNGGDFTKGTLTRAGGKWFFVSEETYGRQHRWKFDTSAESYPEEGPAYLYGSMMGRDALAVVVQHGKAVGWFRADEPATVRQVAGLRRRRW